MNLNYGVKDSIMQLESCRYIDQEDYVLESTLEYFDCSSGINPLGYSNKVKDNLSTINGSIIDGYPETSEDIKLSIAKYWNGTRDLKKEQIFLGNGSIEIIYKINKLFMEKGKRALGYSPQFTDYIEDIKSYGGAYEYYLLDESNNFKFDVTFFLNKMDETYDIFYIDNPNNPTGQIIDINSIEQIIIKAKDLNRPVIIDEAYGDFMDKDQSAISLSNKYDNLFIIRTFSKGMGLAGLRAAYLITSENFGAYYHLISNPYEINVLARQIILWALEDKNFMEECIEKVKKDKTKLIHSLKKFSVLETHPQVPIMTIKHPNPQVDLENFLRNHGLLSVSGKGFIGLGKNFARIRLHQNIDGLIKRLQFVEHQI